MESHNAVRRAPPYNATASLATTLAALRAHCDSHAPVPPARLVGTCRLLSTPPSSRPTVVSPRSRRTTHDAARRARGSASLRRREGSRPPARSVGSSRASGRRAARRAHSTRGAHPYPPRIATSGWVGKHEGNFLRRHYVTLRWCVCVFVCKSVCKSVCIIASQCARACMSMPGCA